MEDLRMIQRITKIPWWKIADVVGVSEMTIYRWLRKFNEDHHEKILSAMRKIDADAVKKAIKGTVIDGTGKEL